MVAEVGFEIKSAYITSNGHDTLEKSKVKADLKGIVIFFLYCAKPIDTSDSKGIHG
jgi:hypothetical protein